MRKMKYSDEITKMATVPQSIERYKISRKTLMKYAQKYNALVKFGRSVRIDIEQFDKGIYASKAPDGRYKDIRAQIKSAQIDDDENIVGFYIEYSGYGCVGEGFFIPGVPKCRKD